MDFHETGINLQSVAAVTDDSPVVHHDTGVSVRKRSGLKHDVARGGTAHRHLQEPAIMQEGIVEKGCAQDMVWFRSQHNPLAGRPREEEGHRQGVIRIVHPFASDILRGHADP